MSPTDSLPAEPPASEVPAATEPAVSTEPVETEAKVDAPPAKPATMSPVECAVELKKRFPALFGGAAKPLKLRIQVDIQERAPGVFSKQSLAAFFRRHTGSTSYLLAVAKSPQRIDLDGQPAGEITSEHRQVALDELARRRANNDSRRELEEQQRRNRAGLLHDYQTTTLTPANFCALKGVAVDELDGLLAIARNEAEERARQQPAAFERPSRGPNDGRHAPQHRGRAPSRPAR